MSCINEYGPCAFASYLAVFLAYQRGQRLHYQRVVSGVQPVAVPVHRSLQLRLLTSAGVVWCAVMCCAVVWRMSLCGAWLSLYTVCVGVHVCVYMLFHEL